MGGGGVEFSWSEQAERGSGSQRGKAGRDTPSAPGCRQRCSLGAPSSPFSGGPSQSHPPGLEEQVPVSWALAGGLGSTALARGCL